MQVERSRPPRAARKRRRRLSQAGRAGSGTDEADGFAWLRTQGPEVKDFARRLFIANEFQMWADCPRPSCRRAKACRGEDVECFDERRPELRRMVVECTVMLLCATGVSSDEFYDYIEAAEDAADAAADELDMLEA